MGLELTWWVAPTSFSLVFPQTLPGVALFGVYTLLALWLLIKRRADFRAFSPAKSRLFALGLLSIGFTSGAVVLSSSLEGVVLAAPIALLTYPPAVSVIALGALTAIAIWLGPGPGLVAGILMGLAQASFAPISGNDAFVFAGWALCVGLCLHQPYTGSFFKILRLPLIAVSAAALTLLILLSLNRFADSMPPLGLSTLEHMFGPFNTGWTLWLACGLGLGGIFSLLFLLSPQLQPLYRTDMVPLVSRSLRMRFLIALIPLLLCSVVLSVLTVTNRAMQLAREQALAELDRSAAIAGNGITYFFYSGFNLLEKFSANPLLLEPELRQSILEANRQVVPFFQELLLTDAQGRVVTLVPQSVLDRELTFEEEHLVTQALEFGMAQSARLTVLPSGAARLTFIRPLLNGESELPPGVLLGRVQLDINPEMKRILAALQSSHGVGEGFVVDDRGLIMLHREAGAVLRPWSSNPNAQPWAVGAGQAYRDVIPPDGESILVYTRRIEGTSFTVVMQLPSAVVFEMSSAIFRPLLFIQVPIGVLLLFLVPFLVARITQPLRTLAAATDQIAEGNLEIPVRIFGEDEVAQLGSAFEQMRVRLKDRLNDLSLLLRISQSVSATLELDEGVSLILEGILEETGAAVTRFILLENDDRGRVFSAGLTDPTFPGLDRAFTSVVHRRRDPFIEQDLPPGGAAATASSPLRSVAAFPVRLQNRVVAVLWVGALEAQAFDEARVRFLSTLANQAAVLVENARLFETAEGGRQHLAAILASTTDAILVINHERRLLLINPAAQIVLGLDELAYGRPINALNLPETLVQTLTSLGEASHAPPTVEFSLPDGRTFYTSIAPIKGLATTKARRGTEAQAAGWVAVMRDVTHFKELDELKTEFVSTVSHDLRAPLTFMRGYVTMLTMVGELNDKQHEYQERVLEGIGQMSALIDDLLNLRRIEAGLSIRQEPCRLGLILLEAVDSMRARAAAKGVTLRLEPARPIALGELAGKTRELLPHEKIGDESPGMAESGVSGFMAQRASVAVIGDRTLLRQALGNLVDNAIKYTPAGGLVSVGMDLSEHVAVVRVTDTGMGIAPEDQVRLFEKFYRIKRRETADIAGTGLGLALVKSIVERHQGRVWMESELHKGSTFYVALPLQETRASEETHA